LTGNFPDSYFGIKFQSHPGPEITLKNTVISRRMPEIWIYLKGYNLNNDPDSCLRRNDYVKVILNSFQDLCEDW